MARNVLSRYTITLEHPPNFNDKDLEKACESLDRCRFVETVEELVKEACKKDPYLKLCKVVVDF